MFFTVKVSEGMFDGESVWFIKFDSALEKCRIADQLGVNLASLRVKRQPSNAGKPVGYQHQEVAKKPCFYCDYLYPVKIKKQKVWRNCCKKRECAILYARDRRLFREGKTRELETEQVIRNLKAQGLKVGRERRRGR